MTKLVLVRHGESAANGKGFFAGHLDMELSQRGIEQAAMTARYLKEHYCVDAVYASDLKRAYHTAIPIGETLGLNICRTATLREIYAGDWQGKSFDDLQALYADSYGVWLHDIGMAHPDNGESVKELSVRIWEGIQEIARKEAGKTVVVVTHATPIRTLICRLKGLSLDQMKDTPWVSNASLTEIQVEGDQWTLTQTGLDRHLLGLKTQFPANV